MRRNLQGAKKLLLAEMDEKVLLLIKCITTTERIVNYNNAISIAKAIVLAKDYLFLTVNGGNLQFHYSCLYSISGGLGFSKRKVIVREIVGACEVPDGLVINFDEIPLLFFLISK